MLAVVALLPLQLLLERVWGSEPYPFLTQPDFIGLGPVQDGFITSDRLLIEATFVDGDSRILTVKDLLPDTGGTDPQAILFASLKDPNRSQASDVQRWLSERLAATYPHDEAISVAFARVRCVTRVGGPNSCSDPELQWETVVWLEK